MLIYLLLILGFILLCKGADYFIDGASELADHFRVSHLFIGLTIAAIGTSAPEAAVSIKASIIGVNEIALGNIIGSNIANIALAIGIAVLFKPLFLDSSTIKFEIPFYIIITIIMLIFALDFLPFHSTHQLSRIEGMIFILLLFLFIIYLLRMAKTDRESNVLFDKKIEHRALFKSIFLVVIGGLAIVVGGHLVVDNAVKVAIFWGVSKKLIGISVVALGTSIPEIVTSITAGLKGKSSIAVGNIVGSNIFNILFVLGVASIINPISVQQKIGADIIVCLGFALLFFFFTFRGKKIIQLHGIMFIILYTLYIIYLIFTDKPMII